MKVDGMVAAADVGGSFLTGINGNPLGVLARQLGLPLHKDGPFEMGGDHCFIPGGNAIQRLGYGLLNKVSMLFPHNFWGREIDTFQHLTEDSSMRGGFFLFYSYSSVSGGPLLVALVAGDAAIKFEEMSPVGSVNTVLEILHSIYHPKGIVVPDPVQAICTCWGKDCFSYGSYSYVAVGSLGDDYDILAVTIGDGRVFFAGEATSKQYPATMQGAFLSGMREAANLLRVAKRRSLALSNKAFNDSGENGNLDKLFETPDLKFGSFSALFDPRSNDLESHSLLRVKFQGENLDSGHLCLYGLVSRKQAIQLSEQDGDGNRMKMLHDNFGVKLVVRRGLCTAAESLITSIKATKFSLNDRERWAQEPFHLR